MILKYYIQKIYTYKFIPINYKIDFKYKDYFIIITKQQSLIT